MSGRGWFDSDLLLSGWFSKQKTLEGWFDQTLTDPPTSSGVLATASITENNDTTAATSTVLITGTVTATEEATTLSSNAVVVITGSGSILEVADSLVGAGTVTSAGLTATANIVTGKQIGRASCRERV